MYIPEKITIGNISAELVRKPIKNVYIRVYQPDGRVVVSVPRRMSYRALEHFLESRKDWVSRQHKRLKNTELMLPIQFVDGEYHLFAGRKYLLRVNEGTQKLSVRLYDGCIIMNLDREYDRDARERILDAWYRKALKDSIAGLKEIWEGKMNLSVSEVRIRKMKTKWGTCNVVKKRIWLNLELAKYPPNILEYIMVHEMVHLYERKHNRRFYGLMDKYLPDWRERKKILSFNNDKNGIY